MNNKKGIEALVATVLLILITIAAVGIIWGAIMPIIRQNIESSQNCLNAGIEVNMASGYTYAAGNNVSIQVSRSSSTINVTKIQLKVVDSNGNSGLVDETSIPAPNTDKTYMIDSSLMGLTGAPKSVGVVAIIAIGNTAYTCPAKEAQLK